MSNIYIQEPTTSGKVLLKTTVGDIEIELWSKETPKASRNFIQLCMEGYYDGTIFHRVMPGFIVQGGDPSGTGFGGESIYGSESFKDEFHQRLRFLRRGLVAVANSGSGDNGSQFFFTLDKTPELQNKHTIFGKVVGNTLFNMLKLAECEIDDNDRPLHPHKILSTEVANNPFEDIVPRTLPKQSSSEEDQTKLRRAAIPGTKNLKLLSFGDDVVEDEELPIIKKKKGKSAHDLLSDEKLSAQPAVTHDELGRETTGEAEEEEEPEEDRLERERVRRSVREKLSASTRLLREEKPKKQTEDESDEEGESMLWKEKREEEQAQVVALKAEVRKLKKELTAKKEDAEDTTEAPANPIVDAYFAERKKYDEQKKMLPSAKSSSREEQTLQILERFKTRLNAAKEGPSEIAKEPKTTTSSAKPAPKEEDEDEEDFEDPNWFAHVFTAEEETLRQARDANVRDEERYDIYDPRNEMTKRRRKAGEEEGEAKRERRRR